MESKVSWFFFLLAVNVVLMIFFFINCVTSLSISLSFLRFLIFANFLIHSFSMQFFSTTTTKNYSRLTISSIPSFQNHNVHLFLFFWILCNCTTVAPLTPSSSSSSSMVKLEKGKENNQEILVLDFYLKKTRQFK